MSGRSIRRLTPSDLPAYLSIYLHAYPSGKDLSKDCYERYYERNLRSLREFERVNFFGCFEGDLLVATMKLIDFDINLFGQMKKATGLMALAVHPMYKRRGIAREMVRFFEQYTVKSGAAISLLLPFRIDFYKRLGFGCGSKLEEYHLPTLCLPEGPKDDSVKLLDRDGIDEMLFCHADYVRNHHGQLDKFEEEVQDIYDDDRVRRFGYFKGEQMKGYVAFTFESTSDCNYTLNRMDVKELVYEDATVLAGLLGALRRQADLAQSVVIRSGEPDFYHRLDNPQDLGGNYIDFGFLQTNVSAVGTMYKIPDIRAFVEATNHRRFLPVDLAVGFDIRAEGSDKETSFVLRFQRQGEASTWSYETASSAQVRVSCNIADLSSLWMGSAEFGALVRLGNLRIDRSQYLPLLDSLFHCLQKPFTNTDY